MEKINVVVVKRLAARATIRELAGVLDRFLGADQAIDYDLALNTRSALRRKLAAADGHAQTSLRNGRGRSRASARRRARRLEAHALVGGRS